MKNNFKCSRCGLCCTLLYRNEIYKDLDRGDGVCKHFNLKTKLCGIYLARPLICRVDEMYEKYFYKMFTREEYYNLNYKYCMEFKHNNRLIV